MPFVASFYRTSLCSDNTKAQSMFNETVNHYTAAAAAAAAS